MDSKREFVSLALQEGCNRRELCRRFGISPKAGYALIHRYEQQGVAAFQARSRRPRSSPRRTAATLEQAIVELRQTHPAWGGRKLARRLRELGWLAVPSPATITAVLHRHGLISPQDHEAAQAWQRFEHDTPNSLWQIDFKGHFETLQGRCHPLTLLDDHSRFNLLLNACSQPNTIQVQNQLRTAFRHYGMPLRINADNGPPWGSPAAPHQLSALSLWLIRLGIRVSHSAAYHPQTNGKLERFHRSLKAEVLNGRSFGNLAQAQAAFSRWRQVYNHERPHQALQLQTPDQRYGISPRRYPDTLPPIEYGPDDTVLTVGCNGVVRFQGRQLRVSKALHRLPIAVRPDAQNDGCFDLYFCHHRFMKLDLNGPTDSP